MNLSDVDCYALRRACVGLPVDTGSLSTGVAMLITACGGDIPRLINAIDGVGALARVMKFDPNAPAPQSKSSTVWIPDLPKGAILSGDALAQAEQVGSWWRKTVDWAKSRSPMTPHHFFEIGVVWLISLAIARRVCIEKHERIYPHLYLIFVAETSRFAKSTGMNTMAYLVHQTMPYLLMPGQTSPEGMIEMLSGNTPANYDKLSADDKAMVDKGINYASQRGIILDEYSSLLGNSKKDYMAGFVELLMRLYDARELEQHYTRSGGLILVKRPAINIMGATTPAAMARALSAEDWENGAMARYMLMYREEPLPYNPFYSAIKPPDGIVEPIKALLGKLFAYDADDVLTASMSDDALKAYDAYAKAMMHDLVGDDLDDRLMGNYRRMHINALKIALALATMDWAMGTFGDKIPRPEITLGHWAIAQTITEKARNGLHRLMPVLSESRDSRTQRDIETILKQHPAGVTIRDIVRFVGKATKDVRSAIDVLVESGKVEVTPISGETGRPTSIYTIKAGG